VEAVLSHHHHPRDEEVRENDQNQEAAARAAVAFAPSSSDHVLQTVAVVDDASHSVAAMGYSQVVETRAYDYPSAAAAVLSAAACHLRCCYAADVDASSPVAEPAVLVVVVVVDY